MKTYTNLWQEIISFKNLLLAYKKAKKAKPYTNETLSFSLNLEKNLIELQEELSNESYKQSKYRVFIIFDPKKRTIKYLPFKDRVVHHAIVNVIEPIFEKGFISTSYACRKKKGTHKALKDIKHKIYNKFKEENYCLKGDIKKYFPSINQDFLKKIISRKIKDKKTLNLIYKIIESDHSEFGEHKGIPIGNLTSQLFSNIYLNQLDYYVKQELNIKHYYRYVDDFIILEKSKKQLQIYKRKLKYFLKKELNLELPKEKCNIFKIKDGVDFVGYKIFTNKIFLRKRNIKRFIKKIKDKDSNNYNSVIYSYLGYFKYANSYFLLQKLFNKYKDNLNINFVRIFS
ncbi:MAG: reverse transcriptase domain-containing protein [Candidatus ainarchaeum sp.]|nr:reverse transcriptase domain-containing protein [Candidatus ainarchaeum sp.]